VINLKKKIFFTIKLLFSLVAFLTLVLFFYAAFFYDSKLVEEKIVKKNDSIETESEDKTNNQDKEIKKEELKKEKIKTEPKKIIKTDTTIKDGLFATVGNKAITKSDIVNEIKMILILNNKSYSQEESQQLQNMAIKALIKRNVKKIEVEKYNFNEYSQNDLNREMLRLAKNLDISLNKLKEICKANGLDFSIVEDQIKTDLRWNSLIFQTYKDRLSINLEEIDDQIKLMQNKKDNEEYLISEIVIEKVEKDKIKSTIENLKNKIESEGFENVAINSSISDSSSRGGNLGWINENLIVEKLRSVISNTPIGNISEPIFLPNGILIFYVKDKRTVKKEINIEELKNQLVNAEKTKILQMHSLSHLNNARRSASIKFFQ